MPKLLIRIIAFLLVPCLLADPVLAGYTGLQNSPGNPTLSHSDPLFTDQALTLKLTAYFRHIFNQPATVAGFNQLNAVSAAAGVPISRRHFFKTVGSQQASDATSENVRQDILRIFSEHKNFQQEIDDIFDFKLVGSDLGLKREDLHSSMAAFVAFIQTATIRPLDAVSKGHISLDLSANTFSYNPSLWREINLVGHGVLFHEAIHLGTLQVQLFHEMREAQVQLRKPELRPTSADKARLIRNPEFRKNVITNVGIKWSSELQATYAQIAFHAARARGRGISVQAYLDDQYRENPQSVILVAERELAKGFSPLGALSEFRYAVFVHFVLLSHAQNAMYVWMLAENPDLERIIVKQANAQPLTSDEANRLFDWAEQTFLLGPSSPSEPSGYIESYRVVFGLLGGLTGLALWRWNRMRHKPVIKAAQKNSRRFKKHAILLITGSSLLSAGCTVPGGSTHLQISGLALAWLVSSGTLLWWKLIPAWRAWRKARSDYQDAKAKKRPKLDEQIRRERRTLITWGLGLIGLSSIAGRLGVQLANPTLDEPYVRRELQRLLRDLNFFEDEITAMSLPSNLGLTREEVGNGVRDLYRLIGAGRLTLTSGGRAAQVAFGVEAVEDVFVVSKDRFHDLLNGDNFILLHEAIHRTTRQKEQNAILLAAEKGLDEGLKPYWTEEAKRSSRFTAADVRTSGAWNEGAFRESSQLADQARTYLRILWQAELHAHYVGLSLLQVRASRDQLSLSGYIEKQLQTIAHEQNIPYTDYLRLQAAQEINDRGTKWYAELRKARFFDGTAVTPGLEELIFDPYLLGSRDRQYLVQALARVDLEPDPAIDIFEQVDNDPAFRQRYLDWARQTILHSDPLRGPISDRGEKLLSIGVPLFASLAAIGNPASPGMGRRDLFKGILATVIGANGVPALAQQMSLEDRVAAHIASLISRTQPMTEASYTALLTPRYWLTTLSIPAAQAELVARNLREKDAFLTTRFKEIRLLVPVEFLVRMALLHHQVLMQSTLSAMRLEKTPQRRVDLFVRQFLNLVIEEQNGIAALVQQQRAVAPIGLISDPQIRDASALLPPSVGKLFLQVAVALPSSYAARFDVNLLQPFNRSLLSFGYVLRYEIASQATVQRMATVLYQLNRTRERQFPFGGSSFRVSRGSSLWRLGPGMLRIDPISGFAVSGLPDHYIVIQDVLNFVAPRIAAAKRATNPKIAPTDLYTPWDPIYKTVIDRSFTEANENGIAESLAWETTIQAIAYRWYEVTGLEKRSRNRFAHHAPDIARSQETQYAALMALMALSDKPLWQLQQWVVRLPNAGVASANVLNHEVADLLLRDLLRRLSPKSTVPFADLFNVRGLLNRQHGLRLLRLVIEEGVTDAELKRAARQTYQENVGPLLPAVMRPAGDRVADGPLGPRSSPQRLERRDMFSWLVLPGFLGATGSLTKAADQRSPRDRRLTDLFKQAA